MEKEAAELLVRTAALEAVKEFEKFQKKNKRVKVFQNTKKLMENYNRICQSVREGVSELSAEDIYINSNIKSKERYDAFKHFYLDEMTYEQMAEEYGYAERTARRWIADYTVILSVYLFGSDVIVLE